MGLRWFNVLGFVLLLFGLLLNEVVCLNILNGSNFFLVPIALSYLVIAIWLSLREESDPQQTWIISPSQPVLTQWGNSGKILPHAALPTHSFWNLHLDL